MDSSLPGRIVGGLARLIAIAGGTVLLLGALVTVISVAGRAFIWAGLTSIRGDFELVEAAVGFAVFCFLPWAHYTRGHAVVTIFTDALGPRINALLLVLSDLLMLLVAAFLTWRHTYGMLDKLDYGETTLLLRFPLWWSYAAGLPGAAIFVLVAVYMLVSSLAAAATGRPPAPTQGALH
jgi:TRAP-type C4-dicarboxylate transport system permease small subunit